MQIQDVLRAAIKQAEQQYSRLLLVAGPPGSGKTVALRSLANEIGCPLVNINLELSRKMLELTRPQRSRQVERLLKGIIAAVPGEVVLLDNLEILFDPSLEIDPLRFLQKADRNRTVVASWNGSYQGGILTYAEPGHPEFTQYKQADATVILAGVGSKRS